MNEKPYLLFDAGGTLVFPDHILTAQIARQAGLQVDEHTLAQAHAQLFRDFDQRVVQERRFPPIHYYPDLFALVSDHPEKVQAAAKLVKKYDQQRSLWTSTFSWVHDTLDQLASQGYHMSVISNSDGRVETILQELDLHAYFEIVIDSFVVGVEKPKQKIFKLALERLALKPQQAIYIGDIYYVDVWGANQAGVGAIHLDKMGLYQGWDGAHIPSVRQLPAWLAQHDGNPQAADLFPALGFEIEYESTG